MDLSVTYTLMGSISKRKLRFQTESEPSSEEITFTRPDGYLQKRTQKGFCGLFRKDSCVVQSYNGSGGSLVQVSRGPRGRLSVKPAGGEQLFYYTADPETAVAWVKTHHFGKAEQEAYIEANKLVDPTTGGGALNDFMYWQEGDGASFNLYRVSIRHS